MAAGLRKADTSLYPAHAPPNSMCAIQHTDAPSMERIIFHEYYVAVADWIGPVSEDKPRPDGPRATQTERLLVPILKGRRR